MGRALTKLMETKMTIEEILKDIHAIQEHLKVFEEKYRLISADFYKLLKANKLDESRDFIEWLGFYEILNDREREYRKLLKIKILEYNLSSPVDEEFFQIT